MASCHGFPVSCWSSSARRSSLSNNQSRRRPSQWPRPRRSERLPRRLVLPQPPDGGAHLLGAQIGQRGDHGTVRRRPHLEARSRLRAIPRPARSDRVGARRQPLGVAGPISAFDDLTARSAIPIATMPRTIDAGTDSIRAGVPHNWSSRQPVRRKPDRASHSRSRESGGAARYGLRRRFDRRQPAKRAPRRCMKTLGSRSNEKPLEDLTGRETGSRTPRCGARRPSADDRWFFSPRSNDREQGWSASSCPSRRATAPRSCSCMAAARPRSRPFRWSNIFQGIRIIALDRPGYGLSDPVEVPRERFREAAIEFLNGGRGEMRLGLRVICARGRLDGWDGEWLRSRARSAYAGSRCSGRRRCSPVLVRRRRCE